MSFRSLVLMLLVGVVVLAPWFVRDWLPHQSDRMDSSAERLAPECPTSRPSPSRTFSQVEFGTGSEPSLPSFRSSRVREAKIRPIETSANTAVTRRTEFAVSETGNNRVARIGQKLQMAGLRLGEPVFCRIFKEEHEFELWVKRKGEPEFSLFQTYELREWSGKPGPKLQAGDRQTPEGFYYVSPGRLGSDSIHRLGFDLGYPNQYDRFHSRWGEPCLVHGAAPSPGSFAVDEAAMTEIYTILAAAMKNRQPFVRVHCFPFRMLDEKMDVAIEAHPENESFWSNLKLGYDFFEIMRQPPDVTITARGNYHFAIE